MLNKILKKTKTGIQLCINYFVYHKKPVIVFAPGHVGSMALHKNLLEQDFFAFKVEFLNSKMEGSTKFVSRYIFRRKKGAKVITIVRDPVAMMVAYYFSKVEAGHIPDAKVALDERNIPLLQKIFVREVLETKRLDTHLYWYDQDFLLATGINIFEYPFDTVRKTGVIEHATYPTLLLRTEMDDEKKAQAIASFLNVPSFVVTRENTRDQKANSDIYRDFKASLKIPTQILEKIYTAPVSRHFLSPEERATTIDKYT